jgi:hypothetical protein
MSEHKDLQSVVDVSADSSVSTSELAQAINGLVPLSFIGLVYCSETRPDITNNPRLIRYIWLDIADPDIPVFRRYTEDRVVLVDHNDSWDEIGVADAGIVYAVSILNSTGAKKIALKHNASADAAKSLYICRIDVAGQYMEVVSLADILTVNSVPLSALDKAGAADGEYLKFTGGALSFEPLNGSSLSNVPIGSLSLGTPLYILRINAGGTSAEWVATNAFLQDGDVTIAKIAAGAAAALQVIRRNVGNTAWEYATPVISKESAVLDGSALSVRAGTRFNIAHTLGVVPKIVRLVLVCNDAAGDAGYAQNDEVEIHGFASDASQIPICALNGLDATNVTITSNSAAQMVLHKTTGTITAITETRWTYKAYSYA